MNHPKVIAPLVLMLACAGGARAQSLFLRSVSEPVVPGSSLELRSTSMFLVEPPEPREFKAHDIIYIIINENSIARSQQSLESTKVNQARNTLNGIIDPMKLLQLRLEGSSIDGLELLNLQVQNQYTGEGEYDRNDQIIARIAAEVIDVKPNGNLVIQAKKSVTTDEEVKTVVLSGIARQDDITLENTLLSSQIADLRLDMQHEGELPRSSKKGIITRALDTLFAF
jgi:flagellar L-ring protein precursor FlgH